MVEMRPQEQGALGRQMAFRTWLVRYAGASPCFDGGTAGCGALCGLRLEYFPELPRAPGSEGAIPRLSALDAVNEALEKP